MLKNKVIRKNPNQIVYKLFIFKRNEMKWNEMKLN